MPTKRRSQKREHGGDPSIRHEAEKRQASMRARTSGRERTDSGAWRAVVRPVRRSPSRYAATSSAPRCPARRARARSRRRHERDTLARAARGVRERSGLMRLHDRESDARSGNFKTVLRTVRDERSPVHGESIGTSAGALKRDFLADVDSGAKDCVPERNHPRPGRPGRDGRPYPNMIFGFPSPR